MRIEKINKIYHNQNKQVHALKDVSVDFIAQGICFIVGKSGSGKSTLLKILAGLDKDYTGSVKGFDGAYYVSSGYDLLSQLTVKQNLSLTRVSEKKTIKALQRYHLSDCENKKVKLLSNGEKRRVQLIKALFMNKRIVLLDETVSALDYENLIEVMDMMKANSASSLFVVVTHNETLLPKYGDQIITLDDGNIVDNKVMHTPSFMGRKNRNRKGDKDTFRACFAYGKELFGQRLGLLLLSIISIVTLCFSIILFADVNSFSSAKQALESNELTLMSRPLNPEPKKDVSYYVYDQQYTNYNSFFYQDIEKSINDYPDMIAINPFYSLLYSEYIPFYEDGASVKKDGEARANNFEAFEFIGLNQEIREETNYILSEAYFQSNENCNGYGCSVDQFFQEDQMIDNKVNVYHLVNDYTSSIQLLAGDYGKANNEIVLDYSLANEYKDVLGVDSVEALIGQSFSLHVLGVKNKMTLDRHYAINDKYKEFEIDPNYIYSDRETIDFVITGVTELDNVNDYNAYLTCPILDNPLLEAFLKEGNHDDLPFNTVNMIFKPGSDMNALKSSMNDYFHLDLSEFIQASELYTVTTQDDRYQSNTIMIVMSCLVTGIMFISLTVLLVINKNKMIQTLDVLDQMDYKRTYYVIYHVTNSIIIMILSLLMINGLQAVMNQQAHQFIMATLMNVNNVMIMITALVVCIYTLVVETILIRK